MSDTPRLKSIIAADIGSTLTHVCLIDKVEGVHRFVARADSPTTLAAPENDITLGLRRAIRQLEHIAQRRLLHDEQPLMPERDTGDGVDALVATSSAALPLRCVIMGLTDDLSVESAERACLSSNATVVHAMQVGAQHKPWKDDILENLRQDPPDVLVMTGGIDRGPTQPLKSAAHVLALIYADIDPERRPALIFAGNQEARRPVADAIGGSLDYRVVDNVRPSVHTESPAELQRELAAVYVQRKVGMLPGYRKLREWCLIPVASTLEALGTTWRYMARRNGLRQGVLGVDVGGMSTSIVSAHESVYQWAIGASLGTGPGIHELLKLTGISSLHRWLTSPMGQMETTSHLENMALRPHGIPQTMEDLMLTHAVIRQAVLLTMRRMRRQLTARQRTWQPNGNDELAQSLTPAFDLIAARGGALVSTPTDGLIALSLLDALQPVGLNRLVLDWASIWPQLGMIARIAPEAASQVLERDSYRDLGAAISPIGEARVGEHALNLTIRQDNGQVVTADILAGEIRRFPLALHEHADIEVRPSHAFDIGLGRKGLGGRARVRGGTLGIVIDARGRPLSLPQSPSMRREQLRRWLAALGEEEANA